ncbi:MAG: hypothetical protein ACE5F1_16270 [Planctomycetota bacterium]
MIDDATIISQELAECGLEPSPANDWNGWEIFPCGCGDGVLLACPGDYGVTCDPREMPCNPDDLLACLRRHGSATTWDHVWAEVATCHEEAE